MAKWFLCFGMACLGFFMMVIGLALGVTLIGLPGGLVIGLTGTALFVGSITYMTK